MKKNKKPIGWAGKYLLTLVIVYSVLTLIFSLECGYFYHDNVTFFIVAVFLLLFFVPHSSSPSSDRVSISSTEISWKADVLGISEDAAATVVATEKLSEQLAAIEKQKQAAEKVEEKQYKY